MVDLLINTLKLVVDGKPKALGRNETMGTETAISGVAGIRLAHLELFLS